MIRIDHRAIAIPTLKARLEYDDRAIHVPLFTYGRALVIKTFVFPLTGTVLSGASIGKVFERGYDERGLFGD